MLCILAVWAVWGISVLRKTSFTNDSWGLEDNSPALLPFHRAALRQNFEFPREIKLWVPTVATSSITHYAFAASPTTRALHMPDEPLTFKALSRDLLLGKPRPWIHHEQNPEGSGWGWNVQETVHTTFYIKKNSCRKLIQWKIRKTSHGQTNLGLKCHIKAFYQKRASPEKFSVKWVIKIWL